MILVIAFGAAIVSAIISFFFMTPIYQSSTQILVNQKKQEGAAIQYNEVQTNIQLTNTYKVIIKSPVILDQVKEKLGLNLTTEALNEKIEVANKKDSQVVEVTVQDKNPKLARDIANTTAEVFQSEVAVLTMLLYYQKRNYQKNYRLLNLDQMLNRICSWFNGCSWFGILTRILR